jgi:hypothetical protein
VRKPLAKQTKSCQVAWDECASALTLRPQLRGRLLNGTETVEAITGALYLKPQQQYDADWVASQQAAELRFCDDHPTASCNPVCDPKHPCAACGSWKPSQDFQSEAVYVSGYPLCGFVGYKVGRLPVYQLNGDHIHDWKVFLQMRDFRHEVTPERYQAFAQLLHDQYSYVGDTKISSIGVNERYGYNQVILHANTHAAAIAAEKAAAAFFGSDVIGHGRGFDISKDNEQSTLDWHHYLCAFDPTQGQDALSDAPLAYLMYRD